ncbi:hypothetical protein BJN34_0300 [Cupriavidus necator]|uniref:Amidohydrolase-related domain-containing protein n=1 Tax=Cupriavidus necator TaxID=106590 RepID=A0A2P1DV33_CUPNE|nr:hypothetical protein BJN34_0300 [Cupriavidus necator]
MHSSTFTCAHERANLTIRDLNMSAVEQESLPPPESYTTPTFVVPDGAWDGHSHVTPRGSWALVSDASYLPAPAPPEKHRQMRAALGLQRGAVIQASVFGTDNTGVIEALTDEPGILRGVVVAGQTIDDAEIERLHGIGVRGMRFITNGLGGTVGTQAMVALAPRIAEFGWHAEVTSWSNTMARIVACIGGAAMQNRHRSYGWLSSGVRSESSDNPGYPEITR